MEGWKTANKLRAIKRLRYREAGSSGHKELIWSPVDVRRHGRTRMSEPAVGQGLPENAIMRGPTQECAFCAGTGSRKGSICPACKGKGEIKVKTGAAVVCGFCKGRGEDKPRSSVTCLVCKGAGVVPIEEPVSVCSQCWGQGRESGNPNLPCGMCKGKGVISIKEGKMGMARFVSRPSGSAGQVASVVYDMGEAGKTQIGKRLGLSSDYVALVCEFMIKNGYLEKVGRSIYALTPECEAVLAKNEAVDIEKLSSQQLLSLRLIEEEETTIADLSAKAHIPVDQVQKICVALAKKDFLDVLLNGDIRLARKGMMALEKNKTASPEQDENMPD